MSAVLKPGLVDQLKIVSGSFLLGEVIYREHKQTGDRLAWIRLEDARQTVLGFVESRHLHQLSSLRLPAPVFLYGTLEPERPVVRVEQLRRLKLAEIASGASLMPRRWCPPAAQPYLDDLIALERSLPPALKRFVCSVMLDPQITISFLRCKASQRHHHAQPGGLLIHSMELMPNVETLVESLFPGDRMGVALAQVALLFHDLGKIRTVGEGDRPDLQEAPKARRSHEVHTLELLEPHLKNLTAQSPYLGGKLRAAFTTLAQKPKHGGDFATSMIIDLVRFLDQASTARNIGKRMN